MHRKHLSKSGGPNLFGLLVFLIFIVLGFLGVMKVLPLVSGGRFGKADRFNVAIAGPKTGLVSLDVTKKTAVLLSFPNNLYMSEVAFGYGRYPISSVYAAGNLDHRGGETLSATLSEYVGIPVEGYAYLKNEDGEFKKIFLSKDFITSPSDLSILEKVQIMYFVFNLREDKIKVVDVSKLATPLILADGGTAISLEKEEMDNFLSGLFVEGSLQNEDIRVEVVNTTKIPLLGSRVSRLLSNIGITVVNVDSSSLQLDSCKIEADPKVLSSKTVSRISSIYGCKATSMDTGSRASVRLFVGMDYAKKVSP